MLLGCVGPTPTLVEVQTYQVNAPNLFGALEATQRHGPQLKGFEDRAFAAVVPSFFTTFRPTQSGSVCRYNPGGRVELRTNIVFPDWRERERTGQTSAVQWDLITRYAFEHELVHVAIFQQYTRKLESLYRSLQASSCEALEERLKSGERVLWDEQLAKHEAFDAVDYQRFYVFLNAVLSGSITEFPPATR